MAFGIGEIIGLGSSLLGGVLSRNSQKKANNQANAFAREQFDFQKNFVTERVRDAKNAGIHPLYALGAAGPGSPSFSAGATDGLGAGIAQAGAAAAQGFKRGAKIDPLNAELIQSQIAAQKAKAANDLASAGYYDSQTALHKMNLVNTARDMSTLQFGPSGSSPGAPTSTRSKRGTSIGRVTSRKGQTYITDPKGRRIRVEPHQDLPEHVSAQNLRGRRDILNPDLGLDEVGQFEYLLRPWYEQIKAMGFLNPMRPKRRASQLNKYYYWKNRR